MDPITQGQDYIVACVIATEVPPEPVGTFTASMIAPAIVAVCDVIRNRQRDASGQFPKTAVEVVMQRKQFSAVYLQADYWVRAQAGTWFPEHVERCLQAWQSVACGPLYSAWARWYYSPISMNLPFSAPAWASAHTEILVPAISKDYFRFYA